MASSGCTQAGLTTLLLFLILIHQGQHHGQRLHVHEVCCTWTALLSPSNWIYSTKTNLIIIHVSFQDLSGHVLSLMPIGGTPGWICLSSMESYYQQTVDSKNPEAERHQSCARLMQELLQWYQWVNDGANWSMYIEIRNSPCEMDCCWLCVT